LSLAVDVLTIRQGWVTAGGCGSRPAGATTLKVGLTVEPIGATLIGVGAAEATEAIAVEVFRQCERCGQPVSMAVIERALRQLR
jgi:hypothetical protein